MSDIDDLLDAGNASVIAPAGHGKTEAIANLAGRCRRALILTHTHAGVHAIRSRMKRKGISQSQAFVDTIAGWSMRYAFSFPKASKSNRQQPTNDAEWKALYSGAQRTIQVSAIERVVRASYDRIFIDEYQDCGPEQHQLAITLSQIAPTLVFGDPMQGIFEFAGATLSWENEIFHHFPLATELLTPHRWKDANPELGQWIAETRQRLIKGEEIDLSDPRITYRQSTESMDLESFFDNHEGQEGSFAAINAHKGICQKIASATGGRFQAIEEIQAKAMMEYARRWDSSNTIDQRIAVLLWLKNLATKLASRAPSAGEEEQIAKVKAEVNNAAPALSSDNPAVGVLAILKAWRKHPLRRFPRSQLFRDIERATMEVAMQRASTMIEAAEKIRTRASHQGRQLPGRTVSTPLLLKGLEFEHVILPGAEQFAREQKAQAKLFYVAISRARKSLLISARTPSLQFDKPLL